MGMGFGTREYDRQCYHRSTIVAEKVLEIIPYILSIKHDGLRGALSCFYIYLGYLYGLCRSLHK